MIKEKQLPTADNLCHLIKHCYQYSLRYEDLSELQDIVKALYLLLDPKVDRTRQDIKVNIEKRIALVKILKTYLRKIRYVHRSIKEERSAISQAKGLLFKTFKNPENYLGKRKEKKYIKSEVILSNKLDTLNINYFSSKCIITYFNMLLLRIKKLNKQKEIELLK